MIHEAIAVALLAAAIFVRNNRAQGSSGSIGMTLYYGRLAAIALVGVAQILLVLGATTTCTATINGIAIVALIMLSKR